MREAVSCSSSLNVLYLLILKKKKMFSMRPDPFYQDLGGGERNEPNRVIPWVDLCCHAARSYPLWKRLPFISSHYTLTSWGSILVCNRLKKFPCPDPGPHISLECDSNQNRPLPEMLPFYFQNISCHFNLRLFEESLRDI